MNSPETNSPQAAPAAQPEPSGFFSRWSRRKQALRQGQVLPGPPTLALSSPAAPASQPTAPAAAPTAQATSPVPPAPTLQEAQALTPTSDFTPFMARHVSAGVKSAALRRLFADPHFNQMDGLDVYIDDYSQPDPLPQALLQQMNGVPSFQPPASPLPSPPPPQPLHDSAHTVDTAAATVPSTEASADSQPEDVDLQTPLPAASPTITPTPTAPNHAHPDL